MLALLIAGWIYVDFKSGEPRRFIVSGSYCDARLSDRASVIAQIGHGIRVKIARLSLKEPACDEAAGNVLTP
jgi:hypothetical protein